MKILPLNLRLTCSSLFLLIVSINIFGQATKTDAGKKGDYSYFKGGTLSVVPSSHQDIAWMDSIGKCIEFRDVKMITPVLARLKANSDFKFSVEDGSSLREYLERHPDSYDEILKYTRERRLEWGATYKQPYESMYDGESLIRQTYHGRKWLKKTLPGCYFKVYWNEDIPGRSLQMAQILSKSGIPYMQFSRHQPGIYRWYSPDGSFITCYTPGQYDEVGIPVREAQTNINPLSKAFTTLLAEWNNYYRQRNIKPAFQFLYSHDFATPPDYDAFFNDWNSKSERQGKPAINYATATEWFNAVTEGDPEFDKISGERPDDWLYIHGPSHQRTLKASRERDHVFSLPQKDLQHSMLCSRDLLNTDKFMGAELFTMQSVGNGAGEFTDVQQPAMEGFEKMSQYGQQWSLVSEGPGWGCLFKKKKIT